MVSNEPNKPSSEAYGTSGGIDHISSPSPDYARPVKNNANGKEDEAAMNVPDAVGSEETKVPGTKLYSDPANTFWRFDLQVPMQESEIQVDYSIPGLSFTQDSKTDQQSFFIPAISESMRICFHSCNGFSVGTDEEAYSGAALWNDVMRVHQRTPFHVM